MSGRSSLLFCAVAVVLVSGCATARPFRAQNQTQRNGFFEQLNRGTQQSDQEHGPGAVAVGDSAETQDPELSEVRMARLRRLGLRWPLNHVAITSPFGNRTRNNHEGVDLRASRGTSVFASHSGTVIFADGRIRGYGNMIVLKHPSGLATVYAHNSRLFVHKGSQVTEGQRIALSGNTGNSTAPHLHFEVRDGVTALDPMAVLPPPGQGRTLASFRPSRQRRRKRTHLLTRHIKRGRRVASRY